MNNTRVRDKDTLSSEMRPMRMRRNFSWTFLGNTVYAVSQFVMMALLAKLGTKQMVGQYALGIAIATPVITFTNLALRQVQATDARDEYSFRDYLALRLVTTLLALLVIAGIGIAGRYRLETFAVILALGAAKCIEAVSDVFYGLLQQRERMDRVAISMIIKGMLSLLGLGIAVAITHSVFWGSVTLLLVWTVVLLAYDVQSGKRLLSSRSEEEAEAMAAGALQPRWHKQTLWRLGVMALPLALATTWNALSFNVPRYFIEKQGGEDDLGVFAALAYLMLVGTTIVSALGQSASPRLASYFASHNFRAFRQLLVKLVAISAVLGLGGVLVALLAGKPLLTLLYKAEYAEQSAVFVWLMIAAGIGYVGSILGYAVTATRAFGRLTLPYLTMAVLSVALSGWLIPRYGLMGAAWALCGVCLMTCLAPLSLLVRIKTR